MNVQVIKTIEFPLKEWAILRDDRGEIAQIQPVPGTWTLFDGSDRERMAAKQLYVKGLVACPRCGQATMLPESFDPPRELGDAKPPCEYKCGRCALVCCIVLREWDRRKLYCACYETRLGDSILPHKQYMHAVDENEAHHFFWAQHMGGDVTNLVAIAPVVGFLPEDGTGKDDKHLIV